MATSASCATTLPPLLLSSSSSSSSSAKSRCQSSSSGVVVTASSQSVNPLPAASTMVLTKPLMALINQGRKIGRNVTAMATTGEPFFATSSSTTTTTDAPSAPSSSSPSEEKENIKVVAEEDAAITTTTTTSSSTTDLPEFVNTLQQTWDKIEDKYAVTSLAVAAVVGLTASAGMISAIDRLPLVPGVLELVGIGYTGWFAYKNLLFKPERVALIQKIKDTYKDIIGTT